VAFGVDDGKMYVKSFTYVDPKIARCLALFMAALANPAKCPDPFAELVPIRALLRAGDEVLEGSKS